MTTMRPIRDTISLEDALATILEAATPIARTERVPLRDAGGRVIAAPPIATMDVPPFDRAAMDGYAVRAEDTFGAGRYDPKTLRCDRDGLTGAGRRREPSGRASASEIATGAPMPQGADAVVMVEETERAAGSDDVRILTPVYPRQHVGRRAADIAAGQTVLRRRRRPESEPHRRARRRRHDARSRSTRGRAIAILSTGNEIVEPGEPLGPGTDLRHQPLHALGDHHRARRRAGPHAGGAGHPRRALGGDRLGAGRRRARLLRRQLGRRARPDPGRAARARRGRSSTASRSSRASRPCSAGWTASPCSGCRDIPTSCLSNGYMLLVPMVRRMARLPEHRPQIVRVPLARRIVSTTGRHQFYTVRIADGTAVPAFKAVGRHHQHGARRRLSRDSGPGRYRRSRRAGRRKVVLMHVSPLTRAPGFSLVDQKGRVHTLADYLARGRLLLTFHRGTW